MWQHKKKTKHKPFQTLVCKIFVDLRICEMYHQETDCRIESIIRDFAFFVFERTKHQPRRNLRSYLVLQRLCNEAALSPGIDAFWY